MKTSLVEEMFTIIDGFRCDDELDLKNILHKFQYVCLYGAGAQGMYWANKFIFHKNKFFCDKNYNKISRMQEGVECYNPDQLKAYTPDQCIVLITSQQYATEIKNELIQRGINLPIYKLQSKRMETLREYYAQKENKDKIKEKIKLLSGILSDQKSIEVLYGLVKNYCCKHSWDFDYSCAYSDDAQYFHSDIINLANDEVFVDCGSYNGDTTLDFLKKTSKQYRAIYAFEMDERNFYQIRPNIESNFGMLNGIFLFNKGVYSAKKTVHYTGEKTASSICEIKGENLWSIEVDSLDNMKKEGTIINPITFVKMDIEGAEFAALQGMKTIIKQDRPKLAISIYHNPDDLWNIPLYIQKLVPEYKFYIRHYSSFIDETVLYAVI